MMKYNVYDGPYNIYNEILKGIADNDMKLTDPLLHAKLNRASHLINEVHIDHGVAT